MKKQWKAKMVGKVLRRLSLGLILLRAILAYTPTLTKLPDHVSQGLRPTTGKEVRIFPDDEIDLADAILILCKKWDTSFDVEASLEEIEKMALELKVLINTEDNPERIVSLINHYLFEKMSYSIPDHPSRSGFMMLEKKALPQVMKNKKGDCLGLSLLYLALTERLELPFYGVVVPDHFFVRYDDGKKKINIETTRKGKEYEDNYYEKKYKLYPTYRKHDFYLRNLSKKEVVGVFLSSLSHAYYSKGMYDEAIVELKTAIEINPSYDEAYTNLGVAYTGKGMHDEAISEYSKAIEINPNSSEAYYNLGIAYFNKGMYDESIVHFEKAVEINHELAEAYYNLGIAYRHKGMYDEAITQYKKVIEINPNDDSAHCNLGAAYIYKGMYDEAIIELKTAIEINPNDAKAYTNLGATYSRKGMYDDAITAYNKAIEINPNFAQAHSNLGTAYYRKGEYSLAIKHYDRAIELGCSVDPKFLEFLQPYRKK